MAYSSDELVKLIHDSKALSIWNRQRGPVFWYIAGVPGPFYINTEIMIGAELAAKLLEGINAILAETKIPAERAARLEKLILPAYEGNPVYKNIIATMAAEAERQFGKSTYDFLSGGERRDWLFSIPLARLTGLRHAFLLKDLTIYCAEPLKPGEKALHVADLINNAASYFDLWFPALEKAGLICAGTLCVISRGAAGIDRLKAAGQKPVALKAIDLDFFKQSQVNGLISRDTYDEIATHFASPREWAVKYLIDRPALFDAPHIEKKSFERLQSFVAKDPWNLRGEHEGFFKEMRAHIEARIKRDAA